MTEIFLGREALRDGMPRPELRRWYRPIFRGVYCHRTATLDIADRIYAAWLTSDRTGIIGGVAASALHGADWIDADAAVEILTQERRRQPGLIPRTDRIAIDEITVARRLPVTTPARTAYDLGRYQKRAVALGRLDALLRAAPFDSDQVTDLITRYGPTRGVCQLRELLPLVDAGAESPKESWLRLLFIDNGFPPPETQIPVVADSDDQPFAFLDMGWQALRLAAEYDGGQHQTDRAQYVKDQRRLRKLRQCGWEVIKVIAEDRPTEILQRVYTAYRDRGGTQIDKMAWVGRTLAPARRFGREVA